MLSDYAIIKEKALTVQAAEQKGGKPMLKSIEVRTHKKVKRYTDLLKKQGRTAFYEEFYDFNGAFYVLFYR